MSLQLQARVKNTSASTSGFTPFRIGSLQRKCACGNHTMAGGVCAECSKNKRFGLQTKLVVNAPGDIYEREADRMADQVMAAPAHHAVSGAPPRIQRFAGQPDVQTTTMPASVNQALASPGRLLEPALRQDMEQHFGHDFTQVRVHSDANAEQSARDVNAHAYTVGHNIVFGAGRFAPGTLEGKRLIAHELTHVVQQSGTYGGRLDQSDEKHSLSPVTHNTLVAGRENDIGRTSVKYIQREEISTDDNKQRDESLGLGESIVIEGLSLGATVGMPSLRPVIKGGFTGFYTEIRHQVKEGKGEKFIDKVKKLVRSPGDMMEYGKGYLWGILQGLWSPIQGLIDIVKLAWKLQQWQIQTIANVIQNFHEIATMQGSLIDRFSKLGGKLKAFLGGIGNNAMEFVGQLMGAISGGVFELAKTGGHKAGQAIFDFLEKPWGKIGEGVGTVVGTVLIEVIMAVFSGGIGNALTKVGQVLDKVAPTLMKGVRFIASELGTIIAEIRGVVETIKAGLVKVGRSLLKGFEDFIGEAGSIFDDLIAMLKKLFSGAEDAAAKLPIDVPLPVRTPAPHIPAPHIPPATKAPHIEAPGNRPHADSMVPKEPNIDVVAPKKPQVEMTPPKEPPIAKPQADAVKFVEENPNVIKGEPGHQRASVGDGHEIVEVPDPDLPLGIGCELHSSPPHAKVSCPSGMGGKGKETIEQFKQRGGNIKYPEVPENKKMPKKSPSEVTAVSEPTPPEGFEDLPDFEPIDRKRAGVSLAEDHHIASLYDNKSKEMFKKAGMDMDIELNKILDFEEHGQLRGWYDWEKGNYKYYMKGHHEDYKAWVNRLLWDGAPPGLTREQAKQRITKVLQELGQIIRKNPDVLTHGPKISKKLEHLKFEWD